MYDELKGATLSADLGTTQLYEKGDQKFGKFFLISDAVNLKNWHVTPESIPRRLETFVGRPFISEPGLAHFGTDDMPLDKVISKQEDYRAGNIIATNFNESTGIATAIVKFLDTPLGLKTWKELNQGKAIYVSPAIAGINGVTPMGTRLYVDWFGLHLARVAQPAYGVMHATIKQTCEGDEKTCVQKLVASAGLQNSIHFSSYIPKSITPCQMEQNAELLNAIGSLKTEIANLKNQVAEIKTAASIDEPGAMGKKIVPDPLDEKEKQMGTKNDDYDKGPDRRGDSAANDGKNGKTDSKVEDDDNDDDKNSKASATVEQLKIQVANLENKQKATLVNEIISMKASANLIGQKEVAAATADMMKLTLAAIETKHAETADIVQRILEQNPMMQNPENGYRLVSMPSTVSVASADGATSIPKSVRDMNKIMRLRS